MKEDLLQSALELPADQQEEFLRQACGGDTALLQKVQSLLATFVGKHWRMLKVLPNRSS
jgi:hypothetical protein